MSQTPNKFDSDVSAIQLFNDVKEAFAKQVKSLNELKREVTKTDSIDQGQKSKLRISIESLLIDLNEEIFAISEDMSSAFSSNKPSGQDLLFKAQEYEQKKIKIFSKIRSSISLNPLVKIVKGEVASTKCNPNLNHSPPQRENSGQFNRFLNESQSNDNSRDQVSPNANSAMFRNFKNSQGMSGGGISIFQQDSSIQKQGNEFLTLQERESGKRLTKKNVESMETFGKNTIESEQKLSAFERAIRKSSGGSKNFRKQVDGNQGDNSYYDKPTRLLMNSIHTKLKLSQSRSRSGSRQRSQPKSQKSPGMPLRNRGSQPHSRNASGAAVETGSVRGEHRTSNKSMSKQSLNSRKALNQIYSFDNRKKGKKSKCSSSKRSSSSLIALVPKFAGCNPGGINGNLYPRSFQNTSSQSTLKGMNVSSQRLKDKRQNSNMMGKGFGRTNSARQEFKKMRMDGSNSGSSYDIKLNDKKLKNARQETTRIKNQTPDEPQEENFDYKREQLLEFEKKMNASRPNTMQQTDTTSTQLVQNHLKLLGQVRSLGETKGSGVSSALKGFAESKNSEPQFIQPGMANTQPSEAVQQFTSEFEIMRKKFGEMQRSMDTHLENIAALNSKVGGLQDENLKLNADMKVIRTEHSDVLHAVHGLEQKNRSLAKENQILKDMVYGGNSNNKAPYNQEIEQNVYNVPRPLPVAPSDTRHQSQYYNVRGDSAKGRQQILHRPLDFNAQNSVVKNNDSPFQNAMEKRSAREQYLDAKESRLRTIESVEKQRNQSAQLTGTFQTTIDYEAIGGSRRDVAQDQSEVKEDAYSQAQSQYQYQYQEKSRRYEASRSTSPVDERRAATVQQDAHYPALRDRRSTSPKPPLRSYSPKPSMTDQKRYSYVNTERGSVMTGEAHQTQEMLLRDSHMRGYERMMKDYRGTSPLRSEVSPSRPGPSEVKSKQTQPERLDHEQLESAERYDLNSNLKKAAQPREQRDASNEQLSDWVLQRMNQNSNGAELGSRRVR